MKSQVMEGFDAPESKRTKKPTWLLVLVTVWFASMVYAFWYFLLMDARLFYEKPQDQLVEFEKSALSEQLEQYLLLNGYLKQKQAGVYKGFVFHFFNGQCSCEKANRQHVKTLIKKYTKLGYLFLLVPQKQTQGGLTSAELKKPWQSMLAKYEHSVVMLNQHDLKALPIPASPSAAVLDEQGQLAYFGPYALGGVCKADENGLIESVLNSMMAGFKPDHKFIGGFGCFCRWQQQPILNSI